MRLVRFCVRSVEHKFCVRGAWRLLHQCFFSICCCSGYKTINRTIWIWMAVERLLHQNKQQWTIIIMYTRTTHSKQWKNVLRRWANEGHVTIVRSPRCLCAHALHTQTSGPCNKGKWQSKFDFFFSIISSGRQTVGGCTTTTVCALFVHEQAFLHGTEWRICVTKLDLFFLFFFQHQRQRMHWIISSFQLICNNNILKLLIWRAATAWNENKKKTQQYTFATPFCLPFTRDTRSTLFISQTTPHHYFIFFRHWK